MIPIEGLFEAHITVSDLKRSMAFYRDVLGLEVGIVQPERPAAFFWVGGHHPFRGRERADQRASRLCLGSRRVHIL